MADRDGEGPRDHEHGHVGEDEGGDGADEDRPEPPARRLDAPRRGGWRV
jgi:hypothetical protein